MTMASVYMGGSNGHQGKKPTTIATNSARPCQNDGLHDQAEGALPRSLMDDKETNAWSSGFTEIVAQAVSEFHEGAIGDEKKLAALAMKLSKLT